MSKSIINIEFDNNEGKIVLQNKNGTHNISTITNNVVVISPNTNKELIFRVGIMLQHLGIDIQRLVETQDLWQR